MQAILTVIHNARFGPRTMNRKMVKPYRLMPMVPLLALVMTGCAPKQVKYDYTIHKPRVVYQQPSRHALSKSLRQNLGKKYVWAEEGPKAFDCSGLTYYAFGRMNMEIPRVSRDQAKAGIPVPLNELQYGDLVFFDTGKPFTGTVTHVGVYIGDGKFQHASSTAGRVVISSLYERDYSSRILSARRYLPAQASAMHSPISQATW